MKHFLCFISILLVSACAGKIPDVSELNFSNYPTIWPRPLQGLSSGNECMPISGAFLSRGKSNSVLSERFINPVFERSFFNQIEIADESNFFKVYLQTDLREIDFEVFDQNGELLVGGLKKKYEYCANGWYFVESNIGGGSGDNPTRSSYRRTSYGLATDGSLLINTYSEVVSGKWFISSETKYSEIWYRYLPLK